MNSLDMHYNYEPVKPLLCPLISPLMHSVEMQYEPVRPVHCNAAVLRICCHCDAVHKAQEGITPVRVISACKR